MQISSVSDTSAITSSPPASAVAAELPAEPATDVLTLAADGPEEADFPSWDSFEARRHRTLLFLILAGIYLGSHLCNSWLNFQLFKADTWYYFGREGPSWFETMYRFALTFLPIAAWIAIIFLCLTRVSFLTHRRVALLLVLLGLAFFEADMGWYTMSKRHVTLTDIRMFLSLDKSADLGLRPSDYWNFLTLMAIHAGVLAACALLAGPELKAMFWAVMDGGPAGNTYVGRGIKKVLDWGERGARWCRAHRVLSLADNGFALAVVLVAVVADPVIIWALENQEEELEESRSVVREIAETNPLRWHSLDRFWERIVHRFSDGHQDLQAINAAFATTDLDVAKEVHRPEHLHLANRLNKRRDNVLLIQVESLNTTVFAQTELPYVRQFERRSLNLKNHFSSANCTHYGILGFLQGNPVTFYHKRRWGLRCEYLDAFQKNGYKTRIIARLVLDHHSLGSYLQDSWTDKTEEISNDWEGIPLCQDYLRETERDGQPRLAYMFFHHTHYPYWYDETKFKKYTPEVGYEFNYNQPDLVAYKDPIINRYKNTLVSFDEWLRQLLAGIDLERTIVVVAGDHGEELFEQGRLGHCSSFNTYQTMTPCMVYIPGVQAQEVSFLTSHADIMPTVIDAVGIKSGLNRLGRSLFEPVPFRYALVANFEYDRPQRWAVVTEGRKSIVDVVKAPGELEIINLVDWKGRRLSYQDDTAAWEDNLHTVRQLRADLVGWYDARRME